MLRVVLSEPALLDLERIWDWLEANADAGAAERGTGRIVDRCEAIARTPGIGRRRDELIPGCRGLAFGNYLILHRAVGDALDVLRVVDARRDPGRPISED